MAGICILFSFYFILVIYNIQTYEQDFYEVKLIELDIKISCDFDIIQYAYSLKLHIELNILGQRLRRKASPSSIMEIVMRT